MGLKQAVSAALCLGLRVRSLQCAGRRGADAGSRLPVTEDLPGAPIPSVWARKRMCLRAGCVRADGRL